mmetsp:Transcript_14643/g.34236  ORF Transcript_14643/g.34236 Transcript_14643/m.34236 type:complete len:379 (-) Transcript_14643:496-1632(-)
MEAVSRTCSNLWPFLEYLPLMIKSLRRALLDRRTQAMPPSVWEGSWDCKHTMGSWLPLPRVTLACTQKSSERLRTLWLRFTANMRVSLALPDPTRMPSRRASTSEERLVTASARYWCASSCLRSAQSGHSDANLACGTVLVEPLRFLRVCDLILAEIFRPAFLAALTTFLPTFLAVLTAFLTCFLADFFKALPLALALSHRLFFLPLLLFFLARAAFAAASWRRLLRFSALIAALALLAARLAAATRLAAFCLAAATAALAALAFSAARRAAAARASEAFLLAARAAATAAALAALAFLLAASLAARMALLAAAARLAAAALSAASRLRAASLTAAALLLASAARLRATASLLRAAAAAAAARLRAAAALLRASAILL